MLSYGHASPAPEGGAGGESGVFNGSFWRMHVRISNTRLGAWEVVSPLPSFRASYGFNHWLIDGHFTPDYPFAEPMRWRIGDVHISHLCLPPGSLLLVPGAARLSPAPGRRKSGLAHGKQTETATI